MPFSLARRTYAAHGMVATYGQELPIYEHAIDIPTTGRSGIDGIDTP